MRVLLIHGWGFDRRFWEPVAARLRYETCVPDVGFSDGAARGVLPDEFVVAVGHSLGLLWLLAHGVLPASALILGINGFTRFARAADFPDGVAPRILERMEAGLGRDAGAVVRQFHVNCGLSGGPDETAGLPVPESLRRGLHLLRHGDARALRDRVAGVLASRDDAIVPPALTEACFSADRISWSRSGGHLLPLTEPDLCVRFICDAMERHRHAV
ncbi:alpha/beta fold hydrolase [Acetobacter oeni]|nr:alpha/beta fold hydrolase [Acetobacter oeni]MBB3883982.1 pimeloyl-[acyl-carrier protein] methyl ester esterase [Acetobacter oeni]NHO20041.1 alpha/beta hydrolase [Acetobacter oeni]GBR03835.1 hypothetical protein AA21952_1190 [Acetobacter oeni LMG 21952]